MPSKVNVRVKAVNANAKQGSYDAVEITGFDATNNRGFKKKFFATKKDGSATKNAETAYTLNENDWVEITIDDTSYKNVQSLKKIDQPEGVSAPPAGGGNSGGGKGKGNQMSKAEWAEKDRKKESSIHRQVALKAAVEFMKVVGKVKGQDNVALSLDVANKYFDFLQVDNKQPGDEQGVTDVPAPTDADVPPQDEDDDIPF